VSPAVGSIVAINPVLGCGHCTTCATGNPQRCADKEVLGVTPSLTAAFAEYVVVPAGNAVVLDPLAPIEYGALVEPLAVGFHAAQQGGVGSEDRVLVLGGGPIGQACLLAAQRLGASSIAVSEPDAGRRARARELGAAVVSPASPAIADAITASIGGPATIVMDAVGSTQSMSAALQLSVPGARIVLVGMAQPRLDLSAYEISTRERTIIGSFCYSPAEFSQTAAWVAQSGEQLEVLIDERVTLEQAQDAFSRLAAGSTSTCKIMVFPSGLPGQA
jgi:threonine dehydrogenase-like Zn-dependent dehydrogenase